MIDLEQVGTGGISGAVGILLGYLGFKSRLSSIEKKINLKVDEKTCLATKSGVHQRIDDLKDHMDTRFDTLEGFILGRNNVPR